MGPDLVIKQRGLRFCPKIIIALHLQVAARLTALLVGQVGQSLSVCGLPNLALSVFERLWVTCIPAYLVSPHLNPSRSTVRPLQAIQTPYQPLVDAFNPRSLSLLPRTFDSSSTKAAK